MGTTSFLFKCDNGQDAFCWYWNMEEPPKGIVQIIHGQAEHAGRYFELAAYLNSLGFSVYASDLRGHGRTGEMNGNLGDFGDDGFNGIVRDQHLLTGKIRSEHPGIPLYILAHSFGSLIGQEYIKHYGNEIDGIILSGSCRMEGAFLWFGTALAAALRLFGKSKPCKLAYRLTTGSYFKKMKNPLSESDWLNSDPEQVKKFEEDKFCGFILSRNYYYYLGKAVLRLNKDTGRIPKNLPVALLSGAEDPVGLYGKGISKLYESYRSLGITDLEFKLYPGFRHEIINERNRQEVYHDIATWLQKHIDLYYRRVEKNA